MCELIDWVEKQALENLRFRIQDADNLSKQSNSTLTILLAALGGSTAYSFKLLTTEPDADRSVLIAVAAFSIYMLILSATLVIKCLKIVEIPPPTNEPDHLYQKKFSLIELREVELKNIQLRINQAVARNLKTATWLNWIRLMAIAAPLIFLAAWAVS